MSDKRTALYQIDTERSLTRNIQLLRDSIVMLEEENDKLRAELLKAPNANMVAFIVAFEVWLENNEVANKGVYKDTNDVGDWEFWLNILYAL